MALVTVDNLVEQVAGVARKYAGKKKKILRDDIFVAVTDELEVAIPSVYHAVLMVLIESSLTPKAVEQIAEEIKEPCIEFTAQRLPQTLSNILDICSPDILDHSEATLQLTGMKSDSPYFMLTECTKRLQKYVESIENFDMDEYNKLCNHELLSSLKCSDMVLSDSEESESGSEYETESGSEYETESVCSSDSDMWLVWEDKRTELENEIKDKNERIQELENEVKRLRHMVEHTDVQVQAFAILGMTITFLCISIPRFLTREQLMG